MKKEPTDEFVTQIARLCYAEKVPQQKIASMMNISQAKVSRILNLAKDRGIVQISVKEFTPNLPDLEQKIKKKHQLKEVIVIKSQNNTTEDNTRELLGFYGAKLLTQRKKWKTLIGITGGRTLKEFINALDKDDLPTSLQISQLMGNVVSDIDSNDASELGRILAEKNNGIFHPYNSPVLVEDKSVKQSLLKLPQIKTLHNQFKDIELAFVGIGNLTNSIFANVKAINKKELQNLKNENAVGELCGHFFNKKGKECNTPLKAQVMSIELNDLKNIPHVIGIVSGADKQEAVKGAIANQLISGLIIDETLAKQLL